MEIEIRERQKKIERGHQDAFLKHPDMQGARVIDSERKYEEKPDLLIEFHQKKIGVEISLITHELHQDKYSGNYNLSAQIDARNKILKELNANHRNCRTKVELVI